MEWRTTNNQYGDFSRMDPRSPAAVNINVMLGRSITKSKDTKADNVAPDASLPAVEMERKETHSSNQKDVKGNIKSSSLVPDGFQDREVFAGAAKSNIQVGTMRPRSRDGSSRGSGNKNDNNRLASGAGTQYHQQLPSPTSVADAGIRMGGGSMSPKPPEQPKATVSKREPPLLQLRAVGRGYQKPARKKKTTVSECKQVMQMLINTYVHPKDRQRAQDFLAINGLSS